MPTAEAVQTQVRVNLPSELLERLESQAKTTVEDLIVKRLQATADWTSDKPVVLSDAERRAIESAVKQNIGTGVALLRVIERLSKVQIGKTNVQLEAMLNERLRSRCPRNFKFEEFLSKLTVQLLEQYVGLR